MHWLDQLDSSSLGVARRAVAEPLAFFPSFEKYNFIYLFIFGHAGSLLLWGPFSSCSEQGLLFTAVWSLLLRWLLSWSGCLRARGFSSCSSLTLEHRLNNRGASAQLLHCMWDLPRPVIEPVSFVLAGDFSTTELPGKPWAFDFISSFWILQVCVSVKCLPYKAKLWKMLHTNLPLWKDLLFLEMSFCLAALTPFTI